MTDSKIIVALDLPGWNETIDMAIKLRNHVAMFKVGLESYIAHGPKIVRTLRDSGMEVMLDLKIHDIPRTAAAAVARANRLGVELLTVHAAGGSKMIAAARDASDGVKIIAVTVLTSLDAFHFNALHPHEAPYTDGLSMAVVTRNYAKLALDAGADGLVCSALELTALSDFQGQRIVPGVRPVGADHGDQKRVATPKEAVDGGATWIVVGRPIVKANDPVAAAIAINESIAASTPCCHYLHEGFPLCDFIRVVPEEWPEGHTWIRIDDEETSLTVELCLKCVEVRKNPHHVLR